ncbi:zinc-ribbon domain-containing protein [Streptomyces niveus]|uniref:zinc-ribbon domain-containing protein n=1 Tax=Streptomyces niveus TaxID=193462 RepID=UPI0034383AC4|nr:zinc-ribbon domain-containing protein [Streptomyces niveus]
MIIFGTKGYIYQLAILTLVCGQCGNPSAHTLRKRVSKFTLFFVPLFPYSTKHYTQCTFCGVEHQVPNEQAEQLLAQSATQAQQGVGQQHGANPFAQGGQPGGGNPFSQGGQGQQPGQGGNPYQR